MAHKTKCFIHSMHWYVFVFRIAIHVFIDSYAPKIRTDVTCNGSTTSANQNIKKSNCRCTTRITITKTPFAEVPDPVYPAD